jgi:hypothetical protein
LKSAITLLRAMPSGTRAAMISSAVTGLKGGLAGLVVVAAGGGEAAWVSGVLSYGLNLIVIMDG